MNSEIFDLVFSGELVRGAELQQAKKNLGNLFKISGSKVDALFSGEPIVLKKGLDFATATKYRAAIKKAGCRVDLVERAPQKSEVQEAPPQKPPETISQPAEQTQRHVSRPAASESSLPLPEVSEEPVENYQSSQQEEVDSIESISLAPAGSPVLKDDERVEIAAVDVDTSQLELGELGESLSDAEDTAEQTIDLDLDLGLELAPTGSDLLIDSERTGEPQVDVNIPDYSLAEPGAELGQIKEEKEAKVPDTSHLQLG